MDTIDPSLESCLPPELRRLTPTLSRIAAGLSGAGVYRVEAADRLFVLKVAGPGESPDDWRHALDIQRLAAAAGLSPRIIHVDTERRAVLTDFVADRVFAAYYRDPRTHEAALAQLGGLVRRIHALPLPADAPVREPRPFLARLWGGPLAGFAVPDLARQAIEGALAASPPSEAPARVLSHNDLNPTNLLYDGQAILLLDWAAAGATDPFYDLATLAVFLRMDAAACLRLLAAHDDQPRAVFPDGFIYHRDLVAALAGAMQLALARRLGHAGETGAVTASPSLAEFYGRLRAGAVRLGTADGHWAFGLALLNESGRVPPLLSSQ